MAAPGKKPGLAGVWRDLGGFGLLVGRLGHRRCSLVFGAWAAFTVGPFFALGNSLKVQFSLQGLRTERRSLFHVGLAPGAPP